MMYENMTNEELLKEVYLTQHKDRLLTLVCERLEMVMRDLTDALEYEKEVDELNGQLADQDEYIHELNEKLDALETQLDSLTNNDGYYP
jgi:peptidoglycan hydrolase CwlO-like protein